MSFLLLLCDHLQEWGRPRVGPEPLARKVMEALRYSEDAEFDPKIRAPRLEVGGLLLEEKRKRDVGREDCGRCANPSSEDHKCLRFHARVEPGGLRFTLPHCEAREGDFEPVISWLLFCRDLECIGGMGEDSIAPVTITFKHEAPRIWMALRWQPLEMDLLEEYANRDVEAGSLGEWAQRARLGTHGMGYDGDRDTGREQFSLTLHKLEGPFLRPLKDQHWKGYVRWKWQWIGQNYLLRSLGRWSPRS